MTENDAKTIDDCLKELKDHRDVYLKRSTPWRIVNRAVRLIEELKQYRAIGTIDEFKALKEKSVVKKPNQVSKAMDKDKYVGLIGRCPNCGSIVAEDNLVCEDCFQVLDWSE